MELWNEYLEMIIRPDHKLTVQQKRRIRYNLKVVLDSVVEYAGAADFHHFLHAFLKWYERGEELEPGEAFVLLDTVHFMPFELFSEEELGRVGRFAIYEADSKEAEVRIAAWRAFKLITAYQPSHPCCKDIAECVMETTVEGDITMTFLQYRVLNNLGYDTCLLYTSDAADE